MKNEDLKAKRASLPATSISYQSNGISPYNRKDVTLDPFSKNSTFSESPTNVNSVDMTKRMTISNFNNFNGLPSSVSQNNKMNSYRAEKKTFYSPHSGNCLKIDGTCTLDF